MFFEKAEMGRSSEGCVQRPPVSWHDMEWCLENILGGSWSGDRERNYFCSMERDLHAQAPGTCYA